MRRLAFAVVFLAASLGFAADSPFTFPSTPPAPAPPVPPAPVPGAVPLLTPGTWYVINSKVDAVVDGYPDGLVKITREAGPVTIKGVFIDGTGAVETRKYPGPFVFYVEPVGKGRVTLVVTPLGVPLKSSADLGKSVVDVDSGQAPIPPPIPPVPPNPVHTVPAWVIVVEETSQRTPVITLVLNDLAMWKRIEAKGVKYRLYDKDSPDAKNKNYVQMVSGVPLPAVLHLDATGKKLKTYPLPATAAELESMIFTGVLK